MSESDIVLQTLDKVAEEALVQTLNAAYADYFIPIYLNVSSFRQLVMREDIRVERSVAALCDDRVVGMGLLAVRGSRAWIGGLGVIPSYRQLGIGRQIMNGLLGRARDAACARVQLEVITRNEPAISLYRSLGFVKRRRLSVLYTDEAGSAPTAGPALRIDDASPSSLLRELPRFLPIELPWQHELDSTWAVIDRVDGFAARDERGDLVGLCLWSGDDGQAGLMALAGRTVDVGTALLAALRRRLPGARLAYLNVPDDDPMLPALIAAGFKESLAQFEMAVELSQENPNDESG